tara:strand:- start:2310 stop:3248 length:939 start_codon:yes stop_codon:yes gene_type:complete
MKNLKFCVVGCGNHATKRIIPALRNINAKKIDVVSRNSTDLIIDKHYSKLSHALNSSEKETKFIICTPPNLHFDQALQIINSGFNLFIEKPITINLSQLEKIIKFSNSRNIFFVENLMYKYSDFYHNFINHWSKNRDIINQIEINFIIPSVPNKSFRTLSTAFPVNIYDIGCYIVSLINDLEKKTRVTIENVINKKNSSYEIIEASSKMSNAIVTMKFGVGKIYNNSVILKHKDQTEYRFEPFFFGLSGERKIYNNSKDEKSSINFYEENCFERMFKTDNSYWLKTQKSRNAEMINNLSLLDNLHKQYNDLS